MERIKMLIYIIIFVAIVFLIVKHWKTGNRN
jgi:hypothetical protein